MCVCGCTRYHGRKILISLFFFTLYFFSDVPVHVERVLVNDTAQIKCDVSSNLPNDRILLVVWYKDNVPIYR